MLETIQVEATSWFLNARQSDHKVWLIKKGEWKEVSF